VNVCTKIERVGHTAVGRQALGKRGDRRPIRPDSLSSARETESFELAVRQLCAGFQVKAFEGGTQAYLDHE